MLYREITNTELAAFLRGAANYFRARRADEDSANWANESNAERCEIAADRLAKHLSPIPDDAIIPMEFSYDPASRGNEIAAYVRQWYEANRESWWDRLGPRADRRGHHADEFMTRLVNEVTRVRADAKRQAKASKAVEAAEPQ